MTLVWFDEAGSMCIPIQASAWASVQTCWGTKPGVALDRLSSVSFKTFESTISHLVTLVAEDNTTLPMKRHGGVKRTSLLNLLHVGKEQYDREFLGTPWRTHPSRRSGPMGRISGADDFELRTGLESGIY